MPQMALSDILRVEADQTLLDYRCEISGLPLWTLIRISFFRLVMGDLLYGKPIVGGGKHLSTTSRARRLKTILSSAVHNARQHLDGCGTVTIMATSARLQEREGKFFNCLSDYFAAARQADTVVIEDPSDSIWPFPRHYPNVLLHAPIHFSAALRGRFASHRHLAQSRQLVSCVRERAKRLLDWEMGEERSVWLTLICARQAGALPFRYHSYLNLFRRLKTKILIREDGCYGGVCAPALWAARELGIVTAEYQHGAVSVGHDAYNVSQVMRDSDIYQKSLPEFFLAYGDWWNRQTNLPMTKLALGNPYRDEILCDAVTKEFAREDVLVLGDGLETDLYLHMATELAKLLGDTLKVVFRPHPLERERVKGLSLNGHFGNVVIDANADIYRSFASAVATVSELSTGLFEAIGLVPKVFIWDTLKARFAYPTHPFARFSDTAELAEMILDGAGGLVDPHQADELWAPNWKQNYIQFIEHALAR